MSDEHTNPNPALEARLALIREEEKGDLDDLSCPDCGRPRVSVWYTNPMPREYRIWFLCEECDFESRVNMAERPKHFTERRVHFPKECYDKKLISELRVYGPGSDDDKPSE